MFGHYSSRWSDRVSGMEWNRLITFCCMDLRWGTNSQHRCTVCTRTSRATPFNCPLLYKSYRPSTTPSYGRGSNLLKEVSSSEDGCPELGEETGKEEALKITNSHWPFYDPFKSNSSFLFRIPPYFIVVSTDIRDTHTEIGQTVCLCSNKSHVTKTRWLWGLLPLDRLFGRWAPFNS